MGECAEGVGCKALQDRLKEMADHSNKQDIAMVRALDGMTHLTARAEKMVDSFDKCLTSIQQHTTRLNDGRNEMNNLRDDITEGNDDFDAHTVGGDGVPVHHRTLETDLTRRFNEIHVFSGGVVVALILIYAAVFSSPAGDHLVHAIITWFGF